MEGGASISRFAKLPQSDVPGLRLARPLLHHGTTKFSNVPAQALTLMNGPLVAGQARLWAEKTLLDTRRSDRERLDDLFVTAFGRGPTGDETQACLAFLSAWKPAIRRSPRVIQAPFLRQHVKPGPHFAMF